MRLRPSVLFAVLALAVSACGPIKKEASYPTKAEGSDEVHYSDQKRETIWGDDTLGSKLFGGEKDTSGNSGIGVNGFLWRAALDTVSFLPVASADPFGGVILTDWYENPDTPDASRPNTISGAAAPGERYKLNVYILDKTLRADGVRVSVFKQKKDVSGAWRDQAVTDDMGTKVENAILTRARELRVSALPVKK